jgi:enoyl-[acyl-carrier-protein] reductase (NADH)
VTEGILDGKLALVAGVANKRSIAWAIAQALHGAGARLAFTYQGDRLEDSVRKLAATVGSDVVVPCDVSSDESIEDAFDQLGQQLGGLDILAHSIAFAPAESFEGRFIDTSRHAFVTALDISAYSMVAMARSAEPLMAPRGGGAMVTLTYMASERAFPKYNVMAAAKAALECSVRYLAYELGPGSHAGGKGHPRVRPDGSGDREPVAVAAQHRGRRRRQRRPLPLQPAGLDGHRLHALRRFRLSRDGDVGGAVVDSARG